MDLKLKEDEWIKIYENKGQILIVAKELHKGLRSKQDFSHWIKNRIKKYKFIENEDFFKHDNFIVVGNLKRPQIDYYLTIDTAKEICMIENNEMGRNIRKYFIESEKKLQEIMSPNKESIKEIFNGILRYNDEKFEIIEREIKNIDDQIQSINIIIKKIVKE